MRVPGIILFAVHDHINTHKQKPNVETILETVINCFQIEPEMLYAKTPGKINFSKMLVIYLLYQRAQLTHSKIAGYFNLHSASIGATLKRCNEFIDKNNKKFLNHLKRLDFILSK